MKFTFSFFHKKDCVILYLNYRLQEVKIGAVIGAAFLIELPQLDTIISRILTYSQDFKSLERIVGDRLDEF
jgi:hypothetical protein